MVWEKEDVHAGFFLLSPGTLRGKKKGILAFEEGGKKNLWAWRTEKNFLRQLCSLERMRRPLLVLDGCGSFPSMPCWAESWWGDEGSRAEVREIYCWGYIWERWGRRDSWGWDMLVSINQSMRLPASTEKKLTKYKVDACFVCAIMYFCCSASAGLEWANYQ